MQAVESIFGQAGQPDPYQVLERGDVLMFRETPFDLAAADREFILGVRLNPEFHKNIAYKPNTDRISGVAKLDAGAVERLHSILGEYSKRTVAFASQVLARYQPHWKLDYASLRPVEEQGRDLPLKKRNDLLHTDAFPTRPTNGDLILRIFTNVNPTKPRVWITSDPFEPLAAKYAEDAGLRDAAKPDPLFGARKALHAMGLPVVARSPYDRFMLGFHDYLKMNAAYQQGCAKYRFEFPPGATWMVFTDVVPHSVESGQFAMEQTMIIARESLAEPARAPISILEKMAAVRLSA